jgi:ketosteroid isomerase-like protein
MKTFLFACCAFAALAGTVLAQAPDAEREGDKDALRALGRRFEEAINRGDVMSLADAVLPEATAVFMTNDEVTGLPAMQRFFDGIKAQLGPGSRYTIHLKPDDTNFHGDLAIAHGVSEETARLGNGTEIAYVTKWTAVLKKVDGRWQAARLHVSLDPINNSIIDLKFRMQKWVLAGIGALGGLALGFILGRRRRRG